MNCSVGQSNISSASEFGQPLNGGILRLRRPVIGGSESQQAGLGEAKTSRRIGAVHLRRARRR